MTDLRETLLETLLAWMKKQEWRLAKEPYCPECGGWKERPIGERFEGVLVGHAPDCRWQALVRRVEAAGIVERERATSGQDPYPMLGKLL